jgi:hypothetical protein
VADLLDELKDLMEQQKHISSKVHNVISYLQKACEQSTLTSLPKGGKFINGWIVPVSVPMTPMTIHAALRKEHVEVHRIRR